MTLKIYQLLNAKSIMQMHREYSPLSDLKIMEGVPSGQRHSPLGYHPPASEAIMTEVAT